MTTSLAPEALHPSLWRASQLARATTRCVDTGHASLAVQLPGGGWPVGALIDLLVAQHGIGEMRLLGLALSSAAGRGIALVEPPHPPQILALAALGVPASQATWIRSGRTADALWATEQVLRSGTFGAVSFWQNHAHSESLRRLHLAAQQGDTLFFMLRPLAAAQDASPAALRLSLRPAAEGIEIGFVKRRGPRRDDTLFLPMPLDLVGTPRTRRTPADRPATVSSAAKPTIHTGVAHLQLAPEFHAWVRA